LSITKAAGAVAVAATVLTAPACGATPSAARPSPPPSVARQTACGTGMTVGADLDADSDYTVPAATMLGTRDLTWIHGTLGLCAVQIDWTLYSSGNLVYAGTGTESAAGVVALTRAAQADHLEVTYRVMFSVPTPPGTTGTIKPSDPDAWFTSLLAAERPYLEDAQRFHVAEFIAGNEHTTIETDPRWPWFFTQARKIYTGELSYATWGGRPGYAGVTDGDLAQLPPVADYGITAYPLVKLPASASQAQVTAAWEDYLTHIPASVLHRTALDEIGIPAATGAYERPWDWTAFTGPADDQVQARWFQAACVAAGAAHVQGIWFWNFNLADDPAHPFPGLTNIEGRPESEAAIRNCRAEAGQS
jgi:hypothetical protein